MSKASKKFNAEFCYLAFFRIEGFKFLLNPEIFFYCCRYFFVSVPKLLFPKLPIHLSTFAFKWSFQFETKGGGNHDYVLFISIQYGSMLMYEEFSLWSSIFLFLSLLEMTLLGSL
ncbi:hypothetical protein ACH5RR_040242 [Cinchona calisaya]|uniref:Uncharacterized protein n=1 Tax=Cinchona calisaya TaxID=153742 RepID=A0ABD2XU15_9GENT